MNSCLSYTLQYQTVSNSTACTSIQSSKKQNIIVIIIRFWTDRSLSLDYFTTCHPRRITRNFPRALPFSTSSLIPLNRLKILDWFADRNVDFSDCPPIFTLPPFFQFTSLFLVHSAHTLQSIFCLAVCVSLYWSLSSLHLFSLFRLCFSLYLTTFLHFFNLFSKPYTLCLPYPFYSCYVPHEFSFGFVYG